MLFEWLVLQHPVKKSILLPTNVMKSPIFTMFTQMTFFYPFLNIQISKTVTPCPKARTQDTLPGIKVDGFAVSNTY